MSEGPPDRLTAALGKSALAVAVLDRDGRFLEASDAYAALVGVPPDALIGHSFTEFIVDTERARGSRDMAALLQHGVAHVEFLRTRPDGTQIWLEVHASRVALPEERIVVVALDVTARHGVEAELANLRRQNDLILEAVAEGVFGVDAQGRITFVNDAGARILGYDRQELVGKSRHALLHHSRAGGIAYPESRCPIQSTLHDGRVHHASGEMFWRKDGTGVPVDFTSAPIREDGIVTGAAVIFADMSERAQADSIARRANQKIIEIYDRIPEGFVALDREWRIVHMNPATERIRGSRKEEFLGRVIWEAFPDLAGTRFDSEYHRAMAEKTTVHIEEYYPRVGMWFEATAYPSEDGLAIYFRDVTARKRLAEEEKAASVARPLVRKIVQDLVETGGVAHQILQQVGRKLAVDTPAETAPAFLKAYTDMGLGKVEMEKEDGQRYAFTGHDLLEKRPGSRVSTCSFTLGYLSEAVSRIHQGEPTLGTEIECQSRGASQCRFIVQVKKAEEGLARRVKELV